MKKRHLILLLTVVALGVLVFFLASPRLPREPEYQGKPLSFWLQQEVVSPNNLMRLRLTQEATEAVQKIGTNAIPVLFEKMHYTDSPIRRVAFRWLTKATTPRFAERMMIPAGFNPREAALGFQALGATASPAIPRLVQMVNSANEEWALRALCHIGSDSVEPLKNSLPLIADENRRLNIIFHIPILLSEIGLPDAPDFSPVFIQALKRDSLWAVRVNAAQALGTIARSPEVAVPALVDAIGDRESIVRVVAVETIGTFGTNAQGAVPSLQKLLTDKDAQVRAKAAAALQQIEGNSN